MQPAVHLSWFLAERSPALLILKTGMILALPSAALYNHEPSALSCGTGNIFGFWQPSVVPYCHLPEVVALISSVLAPVVESCSNSVDTAVIYKVPPTASLHFK